MRIASFGEELKSAVNRIPPQYLGFLVAIDLVSCGELTIGSLSSIVGPFVQSTIGLGAAGVALGGPAGAALGGAAGAIGGGGGALMLGLIDIAFGILVPHPFFFGLGTLYSLYAIYSFNKVLNSSDIIAAFLVGAMCGCGLPLVTLQWFLRNPTAAFAQTNQDIPTVGVA